MQHGHETTYAGKSVNGVLVPQLLLWWLGQVTLESDLNAHVRLRLLLVTRMGSATDHHNLCRDRKFSNRSAD